MRFETSAPFDCTLIDPVAPSIAPAVNVAPDEIVTVPVLLSVAVGSSDNVPASTLNAPLLLTSTEPPALPAMLAVFAVVFLNVPELLIAAPGNDDEIAVAPLISNVPPARLLIVPTCPPLDIASVLAFSF